MMLGQGGPVKVFVATRPVDFRKGIDGLALAVQEMFGLGATPCVADGRVPLVVELLSPAQRPLQITADLAAFWAGSYEQVKKEMKGRYPRHYWPDNPLEAMPTSTSPACTWSICEMSDTRRTGPVPIFWPMARPSASTLPVPLSL